MLTVLAILAASRGNWLPVVLVLVVAPTLVPYAAGWIIGAVRASLR